MGKTKTFSDSQRQLLAESDFSLEQLSEELLGDVLEGKEEVAGLDDEQLLELLELCNLLYRAGDQLVADEIYDFSFLAELTRRNPDHPWLETVEPEPQLEMKTVELPKRMLSTDKAYDFKSIARWANRIDKAAAECGLVFEDLLFRATPKLDGYAAYDDGVTLYTRGDGYRGTDITRAFERGLRVAGSAERGQGPGEIVVSRSYFQKELAVHFDNSRNFQASLIKEKELEPPAAKAIADGAAVFFPFAELPGWEGDWRTLEENFDGIVDELWNKLDFDIDGIVFEIVDETLREHLGATRHHHRWQIAFKRNTEVAEVRVLHVLAQTSRSGRVNPVAEVEPVRLSGATIRRATAHHYRMVQEKGIGSGALIRLSRSGEVIPKIEDVLEPAEAELPKSCPSCDGELVWENDYLFCVNNMSCPAQITHSIGHFFKTLGNIDGFGPSSINKLYEAGVTRIPAIYELKAYDFENYGFGPKQAENMVAQLQRSLTEPIPDWRFLAAFGVFRMGTGNCEKLLAAYPIERFTSLTEEEIVAVKGFSDKSAAGILAGIKAVHSLFDEMFALGFQLQPTPLESEDGSDGEGQAGPLSGKLLVFTGTMQSGSRNDMKARAKELGGKVGESITGKTDYLVCGAKVGASKMNKAEKLGVEILSEEAYLKMIGD